MAQSPWPPTKLYQGADGWRLVVAGVELTAIPRNWFELRIGNAAGFTVANIHSTVPLVVSHEAEIRPGELRCFEREVLLDLGSGIAIRVEPMVDDDDDNPAYRSLSSLPPTPGEEAFVTKLTSLAPLTADAADNGLKVLRLALQVVQKAAGSDAFYQAAVVAATEIANFERSLILLRNADNTDWNCVASHATTDIVDGDRLPSRSMLKRVLKRGVTVIHDPMRALLEAGDSGDLAPSLGNVECAVASPILDSNRKVIGVLYGDRRKSGDLSPFCTISDVEATLVEILAGAIAGGFARCSEEKLRHMLSGFFSPKVAARLATNPELMAGYDAEVTVLFCDIRGFSAVTEQLGPQKAIAWINDVMSELSVCVLERDGVLVDYVGDELLAMWGAPGDQPDHARCAVDAARSMLRQIDVLRERWCGVLPHRFGAGIGINTGMARVGNVGSKQKFKYGPLGNTVNLGSRLQSATKQLGVDCVISHATAIAADCLADARRIAKLRVVGIEGPIEVYEIVQESSARWRELATDYQLALKNYEDQQFRDAARTLGSLLPRFPEDRLCRKLLSRAVIQLDEPTENFTGVWELTSK